MHYDISVCFCQNAAVLEMVTLGSSHVLLSLALVGLEIYTLIPGNSTEAPLLQVSFSTCPHLCAFMLTYSFFTIFFMNKLAQFTPALSDPGCLWSELCVKEFGCEEHTGDTSAILTVHDK